LTKTKQRAGTANQPEARKEKDKMSKENKNFKQTHDKEICCACFLEWYKMANEESGDWDYDFMSKERWKKCEDKQCPKHHSNNGKYNYKVCRKCQIEKTKKQWEETLWRDNMPRMYPYPENCEDCKYKLEHMVKCQTK